MPGLYSQKRIAIRLGSVTTLLGGKLSRPYDMLATRDDNHVDSQRKFIDTQHSFGNGRVWLLPTTTLKVVGGATKISDYRIRKKVRVLKLESLVSGFTGL